MRFFPSLCLIYLENKLVYILFEMFILFHPLQLIFFSLNFKTRYGDRLVPSGRVEQVLMYGSAWKLKQLMVKRKAQSQTATVWQPHSMFVSWTSIWPCTTDTILSNKRFFQQITQTLPSGNLELKTRNKLSFVSISFVSWQVLLKTAKFIMYLCLAHLHSISTNASHWYRLHN